MEIESSKNFKRHVTNDASGKKLLYLNYKNNVNFN